MEIKNVIYDATHIFDNEFVVEKNFDTIPIQVIIDRFEFKKYYLIKKGEEYNSKTEYSLINHIENSFSLIHPSIQKIMQYSTYKPYLLYEYSEEDIILGINDVNLTFETVQKILIGVASGLSYLVSKGYYYQNFSESTIILDKNHYPKLIDYIDFEEPNEESERILLSKFVDLMKFLFRKIEERETHIIINKNLILLMERCKLENNSPTFDDFVVLLKTTPFSEYSSYMIQSPYQEYLKVLHLTDYKEEGGEEGKGKGEDHLTQNANFNSIDEIYDHFFKNKNMTTLSNNDLFLLNSLTENHIKQLTPIIIPLKDKLIRYLYNEDISLIIPNWIKLCNKYSKNPFALYKELMNKIDLLEKQKNDNFYNYKIKEDLLFQIDALRIQAIHFLKEASNQKNINAQIELAVQYSKSYILAPNLRKAKNILESITGADKSAQTLINQIIKKIDNTINKTTIENVINVPEISEIIQNLPENQREILENAKNGKILPMLYAGFAFYTGFNGFPIIQPLSINLYKQAAKKSPDAMALLGYLYFNGIFFPHNLRKARKCFQSAAKNGYVKAEIIDCIIRKHVWRSYLIDFDINELFNYYTQSMDMNDIYQFPIINYKLEKKLEDKSLYILQLRKEEEKLKTKCGTFLFAKKIKPEVKINIDQQYSEKYLIPFVNSNDKMELAKSYYYGLNGYPVNYSISANYFREAAKNGNSEAQWRYAMLCFNSLGADFIKAEYYFRESTIQRNIKGKFYYSLFLKQKNDNLKSNLFKNFLKECCDAGDPDSMYYYAMLLENNSANNLNDSIKYYIEVANKGHFDSLIRLNYIYKAIAHVNVQKYLELSVGMINEKFLIKLIHWYDNKEEYEKSNILIQVGILLNPQLFNLYYAYHLLYGRGVEKRDIEKAKKLASFAFDYNYQPQYQHKYIYLMLQILVNNKEHGKVLQFLLDHKEQLNEKYTKHFHEFYIKFNKNLARKNLIPAFFCCKDYRMNYELILNGCKTYASFAKLQVEAQKENNPFLIAIVGKVYKKEKIVIRNLEKAIQCFAHSAELECPLGYYYIGKEYYYGRYLEQNYTKANRFLQLAIKGNAVPNAGFYLYKISKYRKDLEIDGKEMLKIGALFGHKKALFKYGLQLYEKPRTEENKHQAIKFIRQAAFQNYQKAKNFCIFHKISMKKNRDKKSNDSTIKQTNLSKIMKKKSEFSENSDENDDDSYSVSSELSIKENDSEISDKNNHKKDKMSSSVKTDKKVLSFDDESSLHIDFDQYKISSNANSKKEISINISDSCEIENDF